MPLDRLSVLSSKYLKLTLVSSVKVVICWNSIKVCASSTIQQVSNNTPPPPPLLRDMFALLKRCTHNLNPLYLYLFVSLYDLLLCHPKLHYPNAVSGVGEH